MLELPVRCQQHLPTFPAPTPISLMTLLCQEDNPGTYCVEIPANMTYSTQGEWGWINRMVTSNNASAWRNPGGAFGICQNWSRRGATCGTDPSEPDQVYRLNGTF